MIIGRIRPSCRVERTIGAGGPVAPWHTLLPRRAQNAIFLLLRIVATVAILSRRLRPLPTRCRCSTTVMMRRTPRGVSNKLEPTTTHRVRKVNRFSPYPPTFVSKSIHLDSLRTDQRRTGHSRGGRGGVARARLSGARLESAGAARGGLVALGRRLRHRAEGGGALPHQTPRPQT